MTELLVGTKKGLVVLRGEPGGPFEVAARAFPGEVVEFATRDPRSGRYFAGVTHGQFGPHLFFADAFGTFEVVGNDFLTRLAGRRRLRRRAASRSHGALSRLLHQLRSSL